MRSLSWAIKRLQFSYFILLLHFLFQEVLSQEFSKALWRVQQNDAPMYRNRTNVKW